MVVARQLFWLAPFGAWNHVTPRASSSSGLAGWLWGKSGGAGPQLSPSLQHCLYPLEAALGTLRRSLETPSPGVTCFVSKCHPVTCLPGASSPIILSICIPCLGRQSTAASTRGVLRLRHFSFRSLPTAVPSFLSTTLQPYSQSPPDRCSQLYIHAADSLLSRRLPSTSGLAESYTNTRPQYHLVETLLPCWIAIPPR